MKPRTKQRVAKLAEVLVEYDDEPQVVLLQSPLGGEMLAVAVRRVDMGYPLFGCEVNSKNLDKYFAGKVDLHYVYKHASPNTYFFADLSKLTSDRELPISHAKPEDAANESYWPKSGFFSRSHTTDYKSRSLEGSAVQVFPIDGSWSAPDFSQFNRKVANLYAMYSLLDGLEGSDAATNLTLLRRAVDARPWKGGGSYFQFYESLEDRKSFVPLEVERIQYASPGEIALRGQLSALSSVIHVLNLFDVNGGELDRLASSIRQRLIAEKLLGKGRSGSWGGKASEGFVRQRSLALAEALNIQHMKEIQEACGNNTLILAKFILSVHRRARKLYAFYDEGRVRVGEKEFDDDLS